VNKLVNFYIKGGEFTIWLKEDWVLQKWIPLERSKFKAWEDKLGGKAETMMCSH